MNIVEVLKTNKPIRRRNKSIWHSKYGGAGSTLNDTFIDPSYLLDSFRITVSDLEATDWEVEEEKRELSWEQIDESIRHSLYIYREAWSTEMLSSIREKLGFK